MFNVSFILPILFMWTPPFFLQTLLFTCHPFTYNIFSNCVVKSSLKDFASNQLLMRSLREDSSYKSIIRSSKEFYIWHAGSSSSRKSLVVTNNWHQRWLHKAVLFGQAAKIRDALITVCRSISSLCLPLSCLLFTSSGLDPHCPPLAPEVTCCLMTSGRKDQSRWPEFSQKIEWLR